MIDSWNIKFIKNFVIKIARLNMQGVYSKIKFIEEDGEEDVYCINVPDTGNFVANGIVIRQCDALRYAVCSAFPRGELSHPDENISYDQLRKQVFGHDDMGFLSQSVGGYY